jgi:glycolate oxidase iron-sulfur subunit
MGFIPRKVYCDIIIFSNNMIEKRNLQELEKEKAFSCVKCGLCRSVCPVFDALQKEPAVARGKMALIEALREKKLKEEPKIAHLLSTCLLCGKCQANCPNMVNYVDVMLAARAQLAQETGLPLTKKFLLELFHPNWLLQFGLRLARIAQKIVLRKVPKESGLRLRFPLPFMGRNRLVPQVAKRFLISQYSGEIKAPHEKGKVGLFIGCAINYLLPEIGSSLIELLLQAGYTAVIPPQQGCCGLPATYNGVVKLADKLRHNNIEAFKETDVDIIITACATCGGALKHYYQFTNRLGKPIKVLDMSEFLMAHKSDFKFKSHTDERITYHDPCHLRNIQNISQPPRDLIKNVAGKSFVDMEGADLCCGFGGLFSVFQPEISQAIGDKKAEFIKKSGARLVLTGCPGCVLYLRDGLARNNSDVQVRHLAEFLKESAT